MSGDAAIGDAAIGGAPVGARGRAGRGRVSRLLSAAAGLTIGLALVAGAPLRAEVVAEPEGYRTNDYRTPVPATLKGAKVIDGAAAKALADAAAATPGTGALFVDVYPRPPKPDNLPAGTVWRDPPHESIPGAVWLANVGYGVLPPAMESYLSSRLEQLTGGSKVRPLVFFCLRDCWMSWNAAKRALALGYQDVIWFPEGVDAWREADLPIVNLTPLP